jgi:hypothetical protein
VEKTIPLAAGVAPPVAVVLEELPRDGAISVEAVEGARVFVDGEQIGLAPISRYRLRPGKHTVEVRNPGSTPFELRVTLVAGAHETVRAVLKPLPGLPATATVHKGAVQPEDAPPYDLWAAGGLGVLAAGAAVGAVILFGQGASAEDEGTEAEKTAQTKAELDAAGSHYDDAASLRTAAWISAGVGVAALGGAAYLLLRPQPAGAPGSGGELPVAIEPRVGGAALRVRVRF